ncbi:hypothetical protein D3C81_08650 [compost metagenome]
MKKVYTKNKIGEGDLSFISFDKGLDNVSTDIKISFGLSRDYISSTSLEDLCFGEKELIVAVMAAAEQECKEGEDKLQVAKSIFASVLASDVWEGNISGHVPVNLFFESLGTEKLMGVEAKEVGQHILNLAEKLDTLHDQDKAVMNIFGVFDYKVGDEIITTIVTELNLAEVYETGLFTSPIVAKAYCSNSEFENMIPLACVRKKLYLGKVGSQNKELLSTEYNVRYNTILNFIPMFECEKGKIGAKDEIHSIVDIVAIWLNVGLKEGTTDNIDNLKAEIDMIIVAEDKFHFNSYVFHK